MSALCFSMVLTHRKHMKCAEAAWEAGRGGVGVLGCCLRIILKIRWERLVIQAIH